MGLEDWLEEWGWSQQARCVDSSTDCNIAAWEPPRTVSQVCFQMPKKKLEHLDGRFSPKPRAVGLIRQGVDDLLQGVQQRLGRRSGDADLRRAAGGGGAWCLEWRAHVTSMEVQRGVGPPNNSIPELLRC